MTWLLTARSGHFRRGKDLACTTSMVLATLGTLTLAETRAAPPKPPITPENQQQAGTSRALIIAGIPGDAEHEKQFARIVKEWRSWLTESLAFPARQVHVLFGKQPRDGTSKPATREAVEKVVAELKQSLKPCDRLWVFFLGHANYDGEHAYFHFAGRDLAEEQLGKLFS